MRVNITARHYKASDSLKEYAEKEVRKLAKYFDGIIECEIVLDYEKTIQVVEIAIKVHRQKLLNGNLTTGSNKFRISSSRK